MIASTAQAEIALNNLIVETNKSITPEIESTLKRTSIVALRHITQARSDIHRNELAAARIELDKADRLIETIKDDLSTTTVKNFIWIARKHLEYEPAQQVLHDFPSIYSSLEMISLYIPTDKTRSYVDRAKGYLEKDKKFEAERELGLAERSLIVIEVELPLLKAQRYVTKAQEYLVENNPKKADEALKVAEKRAMALYFGMNSPIIQSKQNVWLAFRNHLTAKREEALKQLGQARINLGKSSVEGDVKGKDEIAKLSNEISELEKKLRGETKVAESELKSAWEKSEALAERSAAYFSTRFSEAETTLGMENNLIEARLHVSYAETYQLTTFEPDKAVKELEIASAHLQKAAKNILVDSKERKEIRQMNNILIDLKLNPKESDITVKDRYETVKDELRQITFNEELDDQFQKIQQK